MGLINVFYRVEVTKLEKEVLPAFRRAIDERSIGPLLPYLDVERIRAEVGHDPTVELRARGLFKKTEVAQFDPSPGLLLGAALGKFARDDKGYDVDKLLYRLRQWTELLSDDDWERWDELLGSAHNLPELFQGDEEPYGFISPEELPLLVDLLRRLATRLANVAPHRPLRRRWWWEPLEWDDRDRERDRARVAQLSDYLSGTAPDGVLVYTG